MGGHGVTTGTNHDHKGNRSEVRRKQKRIVAKRRAQTLKVHRIEIDRVKAQKRTGKAARKAIKADRRHTREMQAEMLKQAEAAAAETTAAKASAAAKGTKKGKKAAAGGVAAMDTA